MFNNNLRDELARKHSGATPLREGDHKVANCYFVTNPVEEYCAIALYSYGRLVAVEDCASQEFTLYCDHDGYEWSHTTMRHILIWARDYIRLRTVRCERVVRSIADIRRVARKVRATDGARIVNGEMVRA